MKTVPADALRSGVCV